MKTTSTTFLIVFPICIGIMLSITGCATTPPEVKMLVVNVRTNVAELHISHAKDVRALAIVVNQREAALKEANCVVRHAFQQMLKAEIEASKAEVLAEFDQRAADMLGAEFQVRLQKDVYPKFDELERTNFDLLVTLKSKGSTNDPLIAVRPASFRCAKLSGLTDGENNRPTPNRWAARPAGLG